MTEMAPEIIAVDLTEIVGEVPIVCDYAQEGHCDSAPAKWVMFVSPCCSGVVTMLACTVCKDLRMASEAGVVCERCDDFVAPARLKYFRIEAL